MARNLIRLSGFVPEQDIEIVFTGLRPGEKLSEELVGSDEHVEPSSVEKVMRVRSTKPPSMDRLGALVAELERFAFEGDVDGTLFQLTTVVPSFTSEPSHSEALPLLKSR
jgi:FlaA1/EpsC-like NDP-sugar epimerase